MIQRDLEEKFNSAIDLGVVALGGAIVSGILLLTPAKTIGYIGMGGSIGGFVASVITKKKLFSCGVEMVAQKDAAINHLNEKLNQSNLEYQVLEAKKGKVLELANQALTRQAELTQLRNEVGSKNDEIATLKSQVEKLIADSSIDLEGIKLIILEALGERQKGLYVALESFAKKKDYQLSDEIVRKFKADIDDTITLYFKSIQEASSLEECLNLLHWGTDELANLKVRMIRSHQSLRIQDLVKQIEELEQINQEWQQADLVPRVKLIELKKNCEAQLREFHLAAKDQIGEIYGYAEQLEKQLPEDEKFFQDLRSQIKRLEQKLVEESKPHRFVGASEQARVGNALIDYYYRSGLILDAIDWHGTELGYKLMFHFGRNGVYISPDTLHENDARQQIKAMTSSLSLPEFKQSERGGYIYLEVQQRMPQKKQISSLEEIKKMWKDATQFERIVSGWRRVRITGGSESGKSPSAENMAICILKTVPKSVGKLYNPQHKSVKNHWTIPVIGTSHADSEKGIAALAKQLDARANGQESDEVFELSIFDEVDSTMSHTKGKKAAIGANVNFIIKQSSHQSLGAIFIGQNANVSNYPGMDRSDWNSAVNVHIGANAYDAITNSNRYTSTEVTKLKEIADKLTDFCNDKNTELGLENTDPEAYRFALVVEPNKKPYFIELPAFGTYTFDQLQQHQQTTPTVELTTPDNTTQALEALVIRSTNGAAIEPQSGYVGSSCPSCNSTNRKKDGKYKGMQRYQCKDCGRRYTDDE